MKILSVSSARIHHCPLPGMLSVIDFHIFPSCWFHHKQTRMCTHNSVLEVVVFVQNPSLSHIALQFGFLTN